MLEDVELVERVPLFLVKKTFDCPLSKQKTDSLYCLSCSYCKRNIRVVDRPFLHDVELSVVCTY